MLQEKKILVLVSSNEFGDAIRKTGLNCINLHSHEEVANYLA